MSFLARAFRGVVARIKGEEPEQNRMWTVFGDRRYMPMPEAVHPALWEVHLTAEGVGYTTRDSRIMAVPVDGSPQAKAIRFHELSHIKWSPAKGPKPEKYGIRLNTLLAVEDCRVNQLGNETGVSPLRDLTIEDESPPPWKQGKMREAVLMLVARHGNGFLRAWEEDLMQQVDIPWKDDAINLARKVRSMMNRLSKRNIRIFKRSTVPMAQWLEAMMDAYEQMEEAQRQAEKEEAANKQGQQLQNGEKKGAHDPQGMKQLLEALTNAGLAKDEQVPGNKEVLEKKKENVPGQNLLDASWGEMEIDEPSRATRFTSPELAKRTRRAYIGPYLKDPMALWSGGKAFGRKKKLPGGTILLDASGSMHINPGMLFDLVKVAPAAQVAVYSGDGFRGVLRILVKDGARVDEQLISAPGGQLNTVDGPALEWLTRQKEPRVWVSDGHVRGKGNAFNPSMIRDCMTLCFHRRILRLETWKEAMDFFVSRNNLLKGRKASR